MSIILAIEPDRRRAAQLTSMARAHLKAELLVAATASQAVEALAGRVPDVLLTAPLLPSHEEAAIGDYLRELGPAATHVQSLTIPLLANSGGDRDRPVLSAFRRGRPQRSEAEGCDPAVFAEPITESLREARERRDVPALVPPPRIDDLDAQPIPVSRALTKPETVSQLLARLFPSADENPTPESRVSIGRSIDLPAEVAEFFGSPPGPVAVASIEPSRPVFDPLDTDFASTYQRNPLAAVSPAIGIRQERTAIPLPVPTVQETPSVPSVVDSQSAQDVAVAVSLTTTDRAVATPKSKRLRKPSVTQDEWAFFDPNQCGFPALIAKLDEIAARDSDS